MSSKEMSLLLNSEEEVKELVAQSSDAAISVKNLSKCFHIYDVPRQRLQQFILPSLARLVGRTAKNYFREFWALRDISFDIRKGETVGIVGKNGSGKSTLLQMICGTLSPTAGKIGTSGRVAALLELGSGFNPEFTGRENVYLNGAILGLTKEEIDSCFDKIASFADIGDFINQPVKTYSSGMAVRLAFAVAIHAEPEILIVDEALSVGDELFQRKCFSRIEAIRQNGATILFVSHSGSAIIELCDRAILLDAGDMLTEGPPKQVVGQYQKLLYATPEKQNEIRAQIRLGSHAYGEIISLEESDKTCLLDGESEENFDPGLQPSSTIAYEAKGAEIKSPTILTLKGKRVNNLRRGKVYRYQYRVCFSKSAFFVRFGMLIKTISGTEIGGALSASLPGEGIEFVEAGTEMQVDFRFRCALNPGVYFLNAGVTGNIDGVDTYLHRMLDVASFRVIPEHGMLATSIVDFSCEPVFQIVAGD